jgi:hypothetical protein
MGFLHELFSEQKDHGRPGFDTPQGDATTASNRLLGQTLNTFWSTQMDGCFRNAEMDGGLFDGIKPGVQQHDRAAIPFGGHPDKRR